MRLGLDVLGLGFWTLGFRDIGFGSWGRCLGIFLIRDRNACEVGAGGSPVGGTLAGLEFGVWGLFIGSAGFGLRVLMNLRV